MGNGWTPERRARQAEAIRRWKPWEKSTGPRTPEGKSISCKNAQTHGRYSQETQESKRMIRHMARLAHAGSRVVTWVRGNIRYTQRVMDCDREEFIESIRRGER